MNKIPASRTHQELRLNGTGEKGKRTLLIAANGAFYLLFLIDILRTEFHLRTANNQQEKENYLVNFYIEM